MENSGGQTDIAFEEADTALKAVVTASLRTIYYLTLVFALMGSFLFVFFPFFSMRVFDQFGAYSLALAQARRTAESQSITGADNTRALVRGLELSDIFLTQAGNNRARRRHADYLEFFSRSYAADPNFIRQNQLIDQFNFEQILLLRPTGRERIIFVLFYSFSDFVYSQNARARSALNITDGWLFENRIVETDYLIGQVKSGELGLNQQAVIYNQIFAAFLENSLPIAETIETALPPRVLYCTLIKGVLKESVQLFLERAHQQYRQNEARLSYLYRLHSVLNLQAALDTEFEFERYKGGLRLYFESLL